MAELKLGRLPDRKPTKIVFRASPDLARALAQYASIYSAAYGQEEPITELIPFMLDAFLKSDRSYAKVSRIDVDAAVSAGQSAKSEHVGRMPDGSAGLPPHEREKRAARTTPTVASREGAEGETVE